MAPVEDKVERQKKKIIFKEEQMKILKQNKGITLIALVVTIIVLLILAGVSLSMVFNQEGIFNRAGNAANKWNAATTNESNYLNNFGETFDNYATRYDPDPTATTTGS